MKNKFKTFIAALLAVVSLQGFTTAAISADAAPLDTITISSGTTVPTTLAEGNCVIVRGTLKSTDSAITGVNIGVFTEGGCRVTGKTIYPDSMSYNLNNVDKYIRFNELEPGTYYYKVYASNASVSSSVIVEQKFTVTGKNRPDVGGSSTQEYINFTGSIDVPKTITEGKGVSIWGTIKSSSKLRTVTVGIYDSDNKAVYSESVYPGTKTYNVHELDNKILFSRLKPGRYYYQVIAANAEGNNHVLTKQDFTVKSKNGDIPSETDKSTVTIENGTKLNEVLTQGYGVFVKGILYSKTTMHAVSVGIYDAVEGTLKTGKTVYPNTTEYNLRSIDNFIKFHSLKPGKYFYTVIVANGENENNVVTKQYFTVKALDDNNSSVGSTENDKNETESSSKLAITGGVAIPTSIKEGSGVIVKGNITSPSKMSALTVAVYDANNKRVTGKTVYPNSKTYDLSKLDEYVSFSSLKPGKYTYSVIVANADGNNNVLSNQKFKVTSNGSSDNTSDNCPTDNTTVCGKSSLTGGTVVPCVVELGHGVTVKGNVSSPSKMSALTVAVYDANNKRVTGKTVYPNSKTYDLSKLDQYVNVSKLDEGKYTYSVIIANDSNNNIVLTKQNFRICD